MTSEKPHHFTVAPGQWEKLKPLGRDMRHQPTPAEDALWQRLRARRIRDAKFRRQHAIGPFLVDFVCIERRLIIEVDGSVHNQPDQQAYDAYRQAALEAFGFRILRFTNSDVLQSLDAVAEIIARALGAAAENNGD